jgi:hypothetical protein
MHNFTSVLYSKYSVYNLESKLTHVFKLKCKMCLLPNITKNLKCFECAFFIA